MKIALRPAKQSDFDFACRVHHLAYKDVVTRQFGSWDDFRQDGFFKKNWEDNKMELVLCDSKECGYISRKRKPDYYWVGEVVLLPEFQGRGIGSGILKEVVDKAAVEKVPVKLQVLTENRARQLYLRLGFRDYGKTDTHYLMEWKPRAT